MLPEYLKVNATNKYGDTYVSKLVSASSIHVKYGSLQVNQIIAKDKTNMAEVDLAYSKGNIEVCKWLKVISKYSKLNIQNSKALIVVSKYSKLNIDKGSSIVCESKYDSYEIGNLHNFVAEGQYSNYRINSVSNKINLDTRYTDTKVSNIPKGFHSIKIENSYGSIKLGISQDASYELDAMAKYAKIHYPSDSRVSKFQENNEMRVEGLIGSDSNNKGKVRIETRYGGINLIKQ